MTLNPSEVLVVNKMAPVTAYVREDIRGKTRRFKTWYEFVAWFDPRHHGHMNLPPNTQEKFTDVLVDTLTDSSRRRAKPVATAERREQPTGRPEGKVRHHRVTMDGREYGSVAKAFTALGLPLDSRCIRFRTELKQKKELPYEGHKFKLVED